MLPLGQELENGAPLWPDKLEKRYTFLWTEAAPHRFSQLARQRVGRWGLTPRPVTLGQGTTSIT